ncbi:MAG: hypothetical protein ACP5XB_29720, partial [Isosphaeraceae bacterium]
ATLGAVPLPSASAVDTTKGGYKYRIAFGCWINDMRSEALPLQQWPAPHLDEVTVSSMLAAMDVQAKAGFNYLDAWGLFATYGYPPDIKSAFNDPARVAQVKRLIREAERRGITYLFGMGLFSWGYDQIIRADPSVRGKSKSGQPLDHVMCGATEKAWSCVEKILDTALDNFGFGGVHLESADLGWCDCPACGGKYGTVGYNARLNIRAADYIKRKWPGKIITCIPINWLGGSGRAHFNHEEQDQIIELSKHIDCFMDQGWNGTFIAEQERPAFIKKLHCDYGTSGGLWVYHCGRWDRLSYFLPYPKRSAAAIRQHYDDGARGCMFYQGPVINPAVELNIAVGGRMLTNPSRSVDDALGEVIDLYYKPANADARRKLVDLFLRAEDAYFGRWDSKRFADAGRSMPGELHLTDLFGTSPGPAHYLLEPFLDAAGRREYKKELLDILKDLASLQGNCNDAGRLKRIEQAITVMLMIVETLQAAGHQT